LPSKNVDCEFYFRFTFFSTLYLLILETFTLKQAQKKVKKNKIIKTTTTTSILYKCQDNDTLIT